YVPQPGGQEPIAVEQIGGSGSEDLNVPGPPEPLVPLRAVGGYRDEVAAHTPHDVLVQTVHPRVGALEPAGAAHITTNDDGGDCFRIELAGPAAHLRIAKPMEGELRLKYVLTTGADERVRRIGCPKRAHTQLPVLEHLRMPHRDRVPGWAAHTHPQPAHQVLPEVEHRLA